MDSRLTRLTGIIPLIAIFAACSRDGVPVPRVQIAIAPLSLPGIGDVCYDLRTMNGAGGTGQVVWAAGDPNVDGDADAICASNYGANGGVTFVGTCDATPLSVGAPSRTNSVTLWVDTLEDTAGQAIAANGPNGWQDPCPSGCTLDVACVENQDAKVEFNIAILRQANQGFFDIGVSFSDIFCSAKVDCRDGQNAPLKLLFHNGARDTTVVSALACTAGPGSDIRSFLYRAPLVVTCDGSTATIPASTNDGNGYTSTSPDPFPADPIWQYAIYSGEEALSCAGSSCNKLYWNIALGLDATADHCTLTTRMSAGPEGLFSGLTTPSATTYPYIQVEVPLTDTAGLTCGKHALNATGSGVSTRYTPLATPVTFTAFYSALVDECTLNTDNCDANATCTDLPVGFSCQCKTGYSGTGQMCSDINECLTLNGGCASNATCTNTPGSRTCACNTGYSGDGFTCSDINECLTLNGGCATNATCANTAGSRTCTCNTGYSGDGVTCSDINECLTNNGGCDPNATCTNTAGGRTCACNAGYTGDGINCGAVVTTVTPDLQLYLTLGDPSSTGLVSGSTWYDQAPSARNATLRGTVSRVTVDDMPAFRMVSSSAGSGDIVIPNFYGNVMANDSTHTYEAWIYLSVNNSVSNVDAFNRGSCGTSCFAYLESGDYYDASGGRGVTGGMVKIGWHHYVLVQSGGTARSYRDGVFVAQQTGYLTPPNVAGDIVMGSRAWSNRQQNWYLNRVRYYSNSLTDAQVLQNYNAEKGLFQRIVTSNLQIHIDPGNRPSYAGSGNIIYNLQTASESFTLQGSPAYSSLGLGSIALNGTTQFFDFGNQSQLYNANTSEFTDEIVFRMSPWTTETSRALLRVDDWSRYEVSVTPSDVKFRLGYQVPYSPVDLLTYTSALATGTWHHLTVVFKLQNRQEIYLDGALVATRVPTGANYGSMVMSGGANIGRGHTDPYSMPFAGNIGVYRHYGRALSAAEVLQNYQAHATRFPD